MNSTVYGLSIFSAWINDQLIGYLEAKALCMQKLYSAISDFPVG